MTDQEMDTGEGQTTIEEFMDHNKITPPASLSELISELYRVFSHDKVDVDYVKTLMTLYKSNPKEWKTFAKYDPHRYTRNLVDEGNGKFNLMILCWNEGQGSSIHAHADSHCFLKLLEGSVKEELFHWPTEEGENVSMVSHTQNQYGRNEVAYICDDIGLHRIENDSHMDKAVTLHLYSPPFDECECYDQRTGHKTSCKVTFWSKFGKRTPFGRGKSSVDVNQALAENN